MKFPNKQAEKGKIEIEIEVALSFLKQGCLHT